MVVRHLLMQCRVWFASVVFALAVSGAALAAQASLVRRIVALPSPSQTVVIVEVDGQFSYRSHAGPDGGSVLVDLEGVLLDEDAVRVLPVTDSRLAGVVVLHDSKSEIVRLAIDLATGSSPHLDATIQGSRLILTFQDAAQEVATPPATALAPPKSSPPRFLPPPATPMVASGGRSPSQVASASSRSAGEESPRSGRATRQDQVQVPLDQKGGHARVPSGGRSEITSPAKRPVLERSVVILDPGHGGKDPGAQAWTGEYEKDIVLDLTKRVARRLRQSGDVDVVMTRSTDQYVTLADRRSASQLWSADVFVSIHANASQNSATRGIETYYHPRATSGARRSGSADRAVRRLARQENEGQEVPATGVVGSGVARTSLSRSSGPVVDRRGESARLARVVQQELVRQLGIRYETVRDLGAKEGPFFVIKENAAPSILVEAAFLTHREEGLRMRSEVYREQIADGVARGILAFLEQQQRVSAL